MLRGLRRPHGEDGAARGGHYASRHAAEKQLGDAGADMAGVAQPAGVRSVLAAAVSAARATPLGPDVVAVAYADHELAGTVAPRIVLDAAAMAGARGVLLDTWSKDGRPLFAWAGQSDLRNWLERARSRGLLTALAGSLSLAHLDLLRWLDPDVFGVRGAACRNGRSGLVSAPLVRRLEAVKTQPEPGLEARV